MRALPVLSLLVLACAATGAMADDAYDACVADGETTLDFRDCGTAWLERVDAELNDTWRKLRSAASEETMANLLDEQRAWIAYKDKSCLFWTTGEYGSIGSVLTFQPCRAKVIRARTAELRSYLKEIGQ